MKRRVVTVLFALAATLVVAIPPAYAAACGDVITADTTLTGNLYCSGDGIIFGADDITLDLGGFLLSGDGTGAGVSDVVGHSGITVRNGKIRRFLNGVHFAGPATLVDFRTIEDLNSRQNTEAGILLENAREVNVNRVRAVNNGTHGLDLVGSLHVAVTDSAFNLNEFSGVRNNSEDVGITDSNMTRNGVVGVYLDHATDGRIAGSRMKGSEWGVSFAASSGHVIENNSMDRNNGNGIFFSMDDPAQGSTLNLIDSNQMWHNGADGVNVFDFLADTTTLLDNSMRFNGRFGVWMNSSAPFVFTGNRIVANGSSGVLVSYGDQTANGNKFLDNGGWGLFADGSSTVAGSSNRATGNVDGQCNVPGLCFP